MDRTYFETQFKSYCNGRFEQVLKLMPHCITLKMNMALERLVSDKEVLKALNSMDLRKVPSIDDLSGMFYKEN